MAWARRLFPFLVIALCTLLLIAPHAIAADGATPLFIDFIQYWCSARLLLEGANPYDPHSLFEMQRTLIPTLDEPVLQWNPPVIFLFTIPFALLPFPLAQSLWIGTLIAALAYSLSILLPLSGISAAPRAKRWSILAALLLFFPFWDCIRFAQISPLALLGFTFFLQSLSRGSETQAWRAGLALSLTMLKPHLLFLVYVYILVERARARSAKLLVGFVAGTLVLGAAPVLLDPSIWREYFEAFRAWPSYFQTPTIGSWIQFFYPEVPLIRFLPAFIAATFSIPFFWFRLRAVRPSWRFVASLSTISLAMSPYGWSYDQVLFLPLVLCLLRHSLASFVAVVMIHLLGFPWAGDVPMQNLVWYPPTLGVVAAYFLWDDLKGTSAESLKEGLSVT